MTVKELAEDMGITELVAREAIKEEKFFYFAWAVGSGKRVKIIINRNRYNLWKNGYDIELIKKALEH
ncbi:hypothetical protein ACQ9ZF_04895 [Cetobacterium somerae]|uniref:hypothetical protein n=1 Tax=Cetobacterium somerae TaxID=188913 RepID=UPI003D768339